MKAYTRASFRIYRYPDGKTTEPTLVSEDSPASEVPSTVYLWAVSLCLCGSCGANWAAVFTVGRDQPEGDPKIVLQCPACLAIDGRQVQTWARYGEGTCPSCGQDVVIGSLNAMDIWPQILECPCGEPLSEMAG